MHAHPTQPTLVTPLNNTPPDLNLVMYRLDQNVAETHKLREEMREGFALIRADIHAMRKDQEVFRKELNDQRLEFTKALHSHRDEFKAELNHHRHEFKAELDHHRHEFKTELQALRQESLAAMEAHREKSRKDFEAMLDRTKSDMKEFFATVIATVDDRIKLSGQDSDIRLLKWCVRSAAGSSAAAGGLTYLLSKFMA